MKSSRELLTESYDYQLPPHLIASSPCYPKDNAKLLIYDRKNDKIIHSRFFNILKFIPKEVAIIFNDTRVIKARVFGKKETGGKIELLLNSPLKDNNFLVYIRGRVKEEQRLLFDENLEAIIQKLNSDGTREVKFFQNGKEVTFENLVKILEEIGRVPLPPYIKREDTLQDEKDYQTLFSKHYGAVASPTASLHFTNELLEDLKKSFETNFITLHVGAGTFKPVEVSKITEHKIHSEIFKIGDKSKKILDSDKKILAVGTTVTRTIEYYNLTKEVEGEANIFLHPLNRPKRVNYLLTNFHLPKSTLIMLVASFIGLDKTLEIYREAIEKEYKFYSYGDAMMIV